MSIDFESPLKQWKVVGSESNLEPHANYKRFNSVKASNKTLQAMSFKTTANLWKWFDELPQVLQINLEDETKKHQPNVLMLQYVRPN